MNADAADNHPKTARHWRGLDELAQTPAFRAAVEREFPAGASEWDDGPSRRRFLQLMAGSLALAGIGGTAGCTRQPTEHILPYVKQPEKLIPGIPQRYATAMPHFGGFVRGVLVESHEGRPTKIEGNPDHPASPGGATDVFTQAAILDLYDPDRAQNVRRGGEISSWDTFYAELAPLLAVQTAKGGAGLRILTEAVTSPTVAAQLDALLKRYPQARWHQHEPWDRARVHEGARWTFNEAVETHPDFRRAKVILALDSDFLFAHPDSLRYARDFAAARRVHLENGVDPASADCCRLHVAEPTPTITGAMADHRLPILASNVEHFAQVFAVVLTGKMSPDDLAASTLFSEDFVPHKTWLLAAARDLLAHPGESVVLAGEHQPPAVHRHVHEINLALGNVGRTITYAPPAGSTAARPLAELTADLRARSVDLLILLGGNPVYTAPAELGFADAIRRADRCVGLGTHFDETAALCHWHLPQTHFLETWQDGRAFDGTVSIGQPLIEPLYPNARSAAQVLDVLLANHPPRLPYDLHRDHWRTVQANVGGEDDAGFERWWRRAVHDGFVADSALPRRALTESEQASVPIDWNRSTTAGRDTLELTLAPDPTVWDGRFTNNPWLQETPKPISKLTWDNAALVSPALAARLGLANEDVVELAAEGGRTVRAPVWITPGQAENSVALSLGYGREGAGRVGDGQGVNAYRLRTSAAPGFAAGLQIRKVPGARWPLAATQQHHALAGREVFRETTLAEFRQRPAAVHGQTADPGSRDTLYPDDHPYPGHAWGMVIDLNVCLGCNACTVACQAENNVPVVGKGEVIRNREMHWIRVDTYFTGDPAAPAFGHQPVPCMHCENAPCEVVCPVEATLHSPEGLNEQVYNRCIGTRYCSNNCPYKVRRFNFLQWADNTTLQYKLQRNPDVTVRSRGVMEKCTYCVQRIQEVKINAQREDNRPIRDGEIVTACQQACPTEAIVFGDLNDQQSRVAKLRAQPHNFGMLSELGTRPRTTYLVKITNPNTANA